MACQRFHLTTESIPRDLGELGETMPVAPQIPNVPIDVDDVGFENEEGEIVSEVDSDDLIPIEDALEVLQSDVSVAAAAADAAQVSATNAINTANGKNKVTFSPLAASGTYTNIAVGDLWFQRDAAGVITGSWEWSGSAWAAKSFGDSVLNSLTAGKITAGTIDLGIGIAVRSASGGARVQMDASGLRLYDASNVAKVVLDSSTGTATFTGTVTGSIISGAITVTSDALNIPATGTGIVNLANSVLGNGPITGGTGQNQTTVHGTLRSRFYDYPTNDYTITERGWTNHVYPYQTDAFTAGTTGRRWQTIYLISAPVVGSDARIKSDVTDSALGLDFVKALRPVSYRHTVGAIEVERDAEGNVVFDADGNAVTTERPGIRTHWGFIAQEVKQAVDASGVNDFAGWLLADKDDADSQQSLRYEQFIAPLTKAVQELSAQVDALKARIEELENKP